MKQVMLSKMQSHCSTRKRGIESEDKACNYLIEKGYTIVARNWRNKRGEIDVIATNNNILVFVEVKTLESGNRDTLEILLGKIKQKKIVETAKCFLQVNRQYIQGYIRFDVLVVDMPGFPSVYHIEDAFSECI